LKIAREGFPWILAAFFGALIALGLGWSWVSVICVLFGLAFAGFFRDPERKGSMEPGVVLAPADGRVVVVGKASGIPGAASEQGTRISIFLSLLDVHVNRAPIQGRVEAVQYRPGRFLAAFKEEASRANEQNAVRLVEKTGRAVEIVQIAGLLARRIICYVKEGQDLESGQRLGIIVFGSRVDTILPEGFEAAVSEGQRVKGGETVLGRLS